MQMGRHLLQPGYDRFALVEYLRNGAATCAAKVVLVWDNLPAHRSRVVKDYVRANNHWLTAEFLPGYAPELNPVEYFWADLKGHASANYTPDSIGELQSTIYAGSPAACAERITVACTTPSTRACCPQIECRYCANGEGGAPSAVRGQRGEDTCKTE